MPNHCDTKLQIRGDAESLRRLVGAVADGDAPISFQRIRPYPDGMDEDSDAAWDWREQEWGARGDPSAYDDDAERLGRPEDGLVTYRYLLDAPAWEIVLTLAKQHPDVEITAGYDWEYLDWLAIRCQGDSSEVLGRGQWDDEGEERERFRRWMARDNESPYPTGRTG